MLNQQTELNRHLRECFTWLTGFRANLPPALVESWETALAEDSFPLGEYETADIGPLVYGVIGLRLLSLAENKRERMAAAKLLLLAAAMTNQGIPDEHTLA